VTEPGRPTKTQRQHRIAHLLGEHTVTSQPRLVELLAEEGIVATQATVSRDLEELGVMKRRAHGEWVYVLPDDHALPVAPADHLRRVFGDWVVEVNQSANLVVLRTPPGSAHVVGSALDRSDLTGLIGTVAGDDTVLCIADEGTGGPELARILRDLAGLADPGKD